MENLEFVIPANKEELLDSSSGFYYIKDTIPTKYLNENLKHAKNSLKSDGAEFILEHFPVYYSILASSEAHHDLLSAAFYDITQALKQLANNLDFLLEEQELDLEVSQKQQKILKMLMYIYSNLIITMDLKMIKRQRDQLLMQPKKGRKGAKNDSFNDDGVDKGAVINLFMLLLRKEIRKLWDPPICEESFIKIIADVLFTFMQDPSIKKDTDLQSLVFHTFGYLLKMYNYSLTFRIRIVQLIKARENEHLTSFVPQGIKTLVEEYQCKSLVRELVRELTEWQTEENMQDAPGTKHCSNILVELTAIIPELMIPEVLYLLKYLNHESHTLRICILTIITEVIICVLCKEEMTDAEKETREELLKQLELHICDINAHVRGKVLQLWTKLQVEGAIPVNRLADILEKGAKRLQDKTVIVRKNAATFVTKFIESNPYSAELNIDVYEKELENAKKNLEDIQKKCNDQIIFEIEEKQKKWAEMEDAVRKVVTDKISQDTQPDQSQSTNVNQNDLVFVIKMYLEDGKYEDAFTVCRNMENEINQKESFKNLPPEKQIEAYLTIFKTFYCDILSNTLAAMNNDFQNDEMQSELEGSRQKIQYFEDVVKFLKIVEKSHTFLYDLLESATISDVSEVIEYFIVANQFKIKGGMRGLEIMLELAKSDDKEKKKLVADACKKLFLEIDEKKSPKEYAVKVVSGLSKLLSSISMSLLSSLGNVISEWVKSGLLNKAVIEYLWEIFTENVPDREITTKDLRVALQLLQFIGKGRPTILEKNLNLIAGIVFSEKGMKDPNLAIIGCTTLAQIGDKPIHIEDEEPQLRIPNEDPMWEKLLDIIEHNFSIKFVGVSGLMKAAVEFAYKLCRYPDAFCEKLIRTLCPLISNGENLVDIHKLSGFIYLCGEVAIRQFHFLDCTIYKEMKRRSYQREKKLKTDKAAAAKAKSRASTVSKNSTDPEESFLEGAEAEDADSDFISGVIENDIVNNNLLGSLVPLLKRILKKTLEYDHEDLQVATTLTMMRYMLISLSFCQLHLDFMLKLLTQTKYSGVKINIIVALADLLKRYPNVITPRSDELYKCVRDPNLEVRNTAVAVITNLLVEQNLRVRGSIAEVALCIQDESTQIRENVQKCFYSLSQQNPNPIYNILPDIISALSNESEQINEETFREVMKFLIKHINKDKQMEPLVEKLCARISSTVNERHSRDISYCLTLLNHNEKSIEKLIECYPSYRLKLEDEEVLQLLISIVEKHKNSAKEEIKNAVKKLDILLRTGKTSDEAKESEDTQSTQSKRKPQTKRSRKKRKM